MSSLVRSSVLSILAALFFCAPSFGEPAETATITITDEVIVNDTHRLGINLEDDAWYGAAQLTKLRDYRNFEGINYRTVFWGPKQTAEGLFSWTGMPKHPPLNQWKEILTGARFTLISGPGYGETGVITNVTTRTYDGRELTFFEFDRPVTPGQGSQNAIMIECNAMADGYLETLSGGYWIAGNNRVVPDGTGGSALQMSSGGMLKLKGLRIEYADADGGWKLKLRAKSETGAPTLSASLTTGSSENQSVELTDEWKEIELDWNAKGAAGEYLQCVLNISGGAALVDDIRFWKTGDENPTAFRDDVVRALKELNPGVLRKLQMGGSTLRNALVNPEDSFAFASSVWTEPGTKGKPFKYRYSLHQFYELCEEINANPWFCLPGTLEPGEITFFMEYLGGSEETDGGKLRAELGHPVPWTETFEQIHVEFGNEAWNSWGPFACSGFYGPNYWENLIAAGKQSPFYSPKVLFYAAGQNFQGHLNKTIARNAPNADRFAIAPYITHDFSPEMETRFDTDEKLFQWLFGYPQIELLRNPGMIENGTIRDSGMELAIYEVNHHTTHGKGSSETRNRLLTSIAGGLNILNTMLLSMEHYGMRDMCFFTMFGEKNTAYEVKDVRLFGALLSMKGGEERHRPHWLAIRTANEIIQGDLIRTEIAGDLPAYSTEIYRKSSKSFETEEGLKTLFSYAFADGKERSLILLNLNVAQSQPVKLKLSGIVAGAPQSWLLTADSIDANNEREQASPQVVVEENTITELANGSVITVPPHSMLALKWTVK